MSEIENMSDDMLLAQINAYDPYDVEFVRRFRALSAKLTEVEGERDDLEGAQILNRNAIRRLKARAEAAETALTAARAALVTALAHLDSSLFTNAEHQRAKETIRSAIAQEKADG